MDKPGEERKTSMFREKKRKHRGGFLLEPYKQMA